MNKILVLPDIHGRNFWEKPCEDIEKYDKVIFLGDYFDPYDFEHITIPECIENFRKIIQLKEKHEDKVVLLIGNHDLPYVFEDYYNFSTYHCRHSKRFHDIISELFNNNLDYFKIAYVVNNILFTHAGVDSNWLKEIVKCNETDIENICKVLNGLKDDVKGLECLYRISFARGGYDRYASCVWADVNDIIVDIDSLEDPYTIVQPIHKVKQVFGHTLQAYYDYDGKIAYGDAIEYKTIKMLDNANAYALDTENFIITKL